jgi:hypothetical protein
MNRATRRAAGYGVVSGLIILWWAAPGQAVAPVSPAAVPYASGPAFPKGHDNRNPPDPRYAAEQAIDKDPATFCCLLDDTLDGQDAATIPARAKAPVTGHMVFDLGRPMTVFGARITGRKDAGGMNPKQVDFFFYSDDNPAAHRGADDLEHDRGIQPLALARELPPLAPGGAENVFWDGVVARYVGLRVNASFECGPVHHNFQIAEVEFFGGPKPEGLVPGSRLPPVYVKKESLAATLLATRANYSAVFVPANRPGQSSPGVPDQAGKLWDQIRRDFPPAANRLLAYLSPDWFGSTGWLAQPKSTRLEESLIRQVCAEVGPAGVHLRAELETLGRSAIPPGDPRWLELCVRAADLQLDWRELASLRRAVEDLSHSFPGQYRGQDFARRLDELEKRLAEGTTVARTARQAEMPLWHRQLQALKHEALVTGNPLLGSAKLLLVKRYSYSPGWYYADFMRASRFGGGLYVLSLADGKLSRLAEQLDGGIFDRFDLSFDGQRVVFGYKAAPGKGFRLWEVRTDGTGLRQITFDPPDEPERIAKYWHPAYKPSGVYRHHTDDFHPCYLPDGGICFASTRCEQGVLCDQGDSLSVNVLYRIGGDGTGMRRLSQNALSESTPSVTNDGRILYTRWEYVDKGVIAVQGLWTMRPDGSGTREVYGNDVEMPPVLIHGRAIPGTEHLFVATGTMHHPFAVGPILLVDARRNVLTAEPIRSLTPDTDLCVIGKDGRPHAEHYAHLVNGQWVNDDRGPLFADPYPLADPATGAGAGKYFLVACNPDRPWSDALAYGLWLIDAFGNRVPIYHDPKISCWQPFPLRPRPCAPLIASAASEDRPGQEQERATVVLQDVYAGLEGVPRGSVKYLRILEQVARPWAARRFWPDDSAFGQHAVVSLNAHIHVKIHHGIVPVDEDGSAHFTVPSEKNLFFQALDKDFMEVQRMRTFVNFRPGEVRGCVGCHQFRPRAPHGAAPLALRRPASLPGPQPGESVPRPIHFPTDVQPILDRHCVQCHSGSRLDGGLDLSGEMTRYFSRSYENLMNRKLLACVQEFYGPQPDAQVTNVEPLPPKALGSHAARLMTFLRSGHYDVKLSEEELVRAVTWIDANGPYYGTYFGRRNWLYKDHADFRPVPTLQSASGVAPPP